MSHLTAIRRAMVNAALAYKCQGNRVQMESHCLTALEYIKVAIRELRRDNGQ